MQGTQGTPWSPAVRCEEGQTCSLPTAPSCLSITSRCCWCLVLGEEEGLRGRGQAYSIPSPLMRSSPFPVSLLRPAPSSRCLQGAQDGG